MLRVLEDLPEAKQQPNLFLAAVNHLGGIAPSYEEFRSFVFDGLDDVLHLTHTKSTQTNEIGRCATLLPALGLLPSPLALIEVGASAGLNLLLDRYLYDYGEGRTLGDSSSGVILPCSLRNEVPIPDRIPEIVWRTGIDLNPIDVNDEEAVRWLESCVFFDHVDRRARLAAAVEMARADPPRVLKGDLLEEVAGVIAHAPDEATVVVFHSAVLAYLDLEDRTRFARLMDQLPVVWLSNEGPSVVRSVKSALDRKLPADLCFLLGRDGVQPLAFTHPHGRWIEWIAKDQRA